MNKPCFFHSPSAEQTIQTNLHGTSLRSWLCMCIDTIVPYTRMLCYPSGCMRREAKETQHGAAELRESRARNLVSRMAQDSICKMLVAGPSHGGSWLLHKSKVLQTGQRKA